MIELSEKRPIGSKNSMRLLALGLVVAALMTLSLMLTAQPAHAQATFTVNSTSDPGGNGCNSTECTLREAITAANRTSSADVINFNILGGTAPVKTISLTSELPAITEPVTIDGYSQPGASPNTLSKGTDANLLIELDGSNAGSSADGLQINGSNVVVRGLVINHYFSAIQIFSSDVPTDNNRIEGNFIGTDPTGTQAASTVFGVDVREGKNNVVGGTSPESRNLISGTGADGVNIENASGTKVLGNLIGTKKDGATPLANVDQGVELINAQRTVVGGTTPGAANTIAFNEDEGILVHGSSSSGNRILGNSIFANGLLGIDLSSELSSSDGDGPTPNDPGDVDTGPNGLQNKPVLTSAKNVGSKTTIKGKLLSKPDKTFTVQFFSNPSGTNEGRKFVGQKRVKTDSEGKGAFTFVPSRRVGVGQAITATATGAEGTSEFSAPRTVVSA